MRPSVLRGWSAFAPAVSSLAAHSGWPASQLAYNGDEPSCVCSKLALAFAKMSSDTHSAWPACAAMYNADASPFIQRSTAAMTPWLLSKVGRPTRFGGMPAPIRMSSRSLRPCLAATISAVPSSSLSLSGNDSRCDFSA